MSVVSGPVLDLQGVTKRFGDLVALRGVDLRIMPGERVALVGPSGAGKSTLLGILNGSVQQTEGQVRLLGQDVAALSPSGRRQLQRQIGTMYQQLHLVHNLRVIHNVNAGHLGSWSFARAFLSLLWPLEVPTAIAALMQVGIADKLYSRTDELSGGQQQRVALARVLVQNPVVMLADEPIASLDPERSREIMDLLRDLCVQHQKTLVASLHLVDFARSHFNRVIGLRDGLVLWDLPAQNVTAGDIQALYVIDQHHQSSQSQLAAPVT
ncbi:MAG: ATP-binding cassette domain-containing protein [Herpetosiphon sp.]